MKQCPVCKITYTDDTLSFCLNDGAALAAPSPSSDVTEQLSFGSNPTRENNPPIRVEFQTETPTQPSTLPRNTTQIERKGISPLAVFIILGLLAVLGIGGIVAAYFVFVKKDNQTAVTQTNSGNVQNSNSNETQELKKELERLKKQIEEQKNAKPSPTTPAIPTVTPTLPPQTVVRARVDSPNDGFLALRSAPSAQTGQQILKIPHGAVVEVGNCQGYTTIGNRRGRWCRVRYEGLEGWSFDGFLIY